MDQGKIGRLIDAMRKQQGLTQEQLGENDVEDRAFIAEKRLPETENQKANRT